MTVLNFCLFDSLIKLYLHGVGGGIDPYVVLQYKSQERKSSVAKGNISPQILLIVFLFIR